MSIQDESFPYDDLEMSHGSGKLMVFPHHKPRIGNKLSSDLANIEGDMLVNNDVSANQDDSTQSSNDCPPESETSGKTNASEPQESETVKKSEYIRNPQNKSISYQDIHSEYTKRRYKHVESKVGQYIANIKAQDEKRRSSGKFQRHRSMPETLSGPRPGESVTELRNTPQKRGVMRHSTNDLDHMHEQESQSDHDTDNFDNLTATTTSSTKELGQDAGIFLDKQAYEQLLCDKERCDYLQSQLEEKNADYWRLKQNLDTMRIEYTLCKDKLKQLHQTQRLSGSFGGSGMVVGNAGRVSFQNPINAQEVKEKATQTDYILTPSPVAPLVSGNEMFATPLISDTNNNSFDHAAVGVLAPAALKVSKTIATIQPLSLNFSNLVEQDNSRDYSINNTMGFLRQRSNSIAARKKSTPLPVAANASNVSSAGSSVPSSSDSAIDIEVIESPRKQRQSRREEFVYFEKQSQRYGILGASNTSCSFRETDNTYSPGGLTTLSNDYKGGSNRKSRNSRSIRTRMFSIFRACTKCDDPNMSVETRDNSQQQSFSQIPLLEKSMMNPRQNLR